MKEMNLRTHSLRSFRGRAAEFLAYFVASLAALAVDTCLLLYLAKFLHYTIAASVSFVLGSIVHYQLCILFVFRQRKMRGRKWAESSVFLLAGLLGLVMNVGVISLCVEFFAAPLLVAKIVAAGCSFLSGFLIRKAALF
jgi:putative flippase GtrA